MWYLVPPVETIADQDEMIDNLWAKATAVDSRFGAVWSTLDTFKTTINAVLERRGGEW